MRRLAFVEHLLVSDRSSSLAVRVPVGAEFQIGDAVLSRPVAGDPVSASGIALNQNIDAERSVHGVQNLVGACRIAEVATSADEQSHSGARPESVIIIPLM